MQYAVGSTSAAQMPSAHCCRAALQAHSALVVMHSLGYAHSTTAGSSAYSCVVRLRPGGHMKVSLKKDFLWCAKYMFLDLCQDNVFLLCAHRVGSRQWIGNVRQPGTMHGMVYNCRIWKFSVGGRLSIRRQPAKRFTTPCMQLLHKSTDSGLKAVTTSSLALLATSRTSPHFIVRHT